MPNLKKGKVAKAKANQSSELANVSNLNLRQREPRYEQ